MLNWIVTPVAITPTTQPLPKSVLRRRQQQGRALRDHKGMLVMRRRPVIGRDHRPLVWCGEDPAGTGGDNRLDRNDQAFGEDLIVARIGIVRYTRRFMDGAADAVARQLANHGEAAAPDFALDGASNFPDSKAG